MEGSLRNHTMGHGEVEQVQHRVVLGVLQNAGVSRAVQNHQAGVVYV